MQQLIPDVVNAQLDKIVAKLFEGNRIADRGMSIINVKFCMNKAEKHLHPALAHIYPKLADVVSEFQASRNNLTAYGFTPEDITDYESPLDFFKRMLSYMQDLETLISDALDIAKDEDTFSYAFLLRFINDINPVTEQCILLVDKGELYQNDWMSFDHRIKDFVIL